MGASMEIEVGGPPGTYTVEHRCGCRVLRGTVPVSDLVALSEQTAAEDEDAIWAPGLTRHLGASAVLGSREAITALAAETGFGVKPEGIALWSTADQIHAWLQRGHVGRSSETLAWRLLGYNPDTETGKIAGKDIDHPHDADDFSRCLTLLDWAPGAREHLAMAADLSPTWAAIIPHWDALEALARSEENGASERLSKELRQLTD